MGGKDETVKEIERKRERIQERRGVQNKVEKEKRARTELK